MRWKGVIGVIFTIVLAIALASLISSCQKAPVEETSAGEAPTTKTITPGVLTVGSDTTYPPFEFMEEGKPVGFDVDLATEIAKRLGLKLNYVSTAWDGIFPALAVHKFDMVMSSVTITEDRKKEMDFSIPYYDSAQSIAVREDSGITGKDDLTGKVVGVQIGTTGELTAKTFEGVEIKTYDDILLAFEDLKAERVDAIVNDLPVNVELVRKNPGLVIAETIPTGEQYGIAFAKDTPELRDAVNKVLKEIMDDGTYDQIYDKWFGTK